MLFLRKLPEASVRPSQGLPPLPLLVTKLEIAVGTEGQLGLQADKGACAQGFVGALRVSSLVHAQVSHSPRCSAQRSPPAVTPTRPGASTQPTGRHSRVDTAAEYMVCPQVIRAPLLVMDLLLALEVILILC